MSYVVILGGNYFIGTSGILTYEDGTALREFFRIREIDRARSEGSYLTLDVDIKDADGIRELKLFKSKPMVVSDQVTVTYEKTQTIAIRDDGQVIINVELLKEDQIRKEIGDRLDKLNINLNEIKIEGVIRIIGTFNVGSYVLRATIDNLAVDSPNIKNLNIRDNIAVGTGGIKLSPYGLGLF